MELIKNMFSNSIATTILYLSLTAAIGVIIGKIEMKKVRIGIAGVLFAGLAISHFGAQFDEHILHFVRDFGLILFVYSIGIDMGPRFFNSFKKDGLLLNVFAACIVFLGFGIAYLIYSITNINSAVMTGILCGAVTNTPGLGAAQQVLTDQGGAVAATATQAGMSYAVAYPFGVIGIIIGMLLLRLFFRIDITKEVELYNQSLGGSGKKLQSVEVTVSNPNLFGKEISYIKQILDSELAVSRIFRNNQYLLATNGQIIEQGDVIYGVSAQEYIEKLRLKMGNVIISEKKNISGALSICNVLLTNRKLTGRTIDQIGIYRRYEANITRIYRSGMEILPTEKTTLELGDTLKIVGKTDVLEDIKNELGNSVKELAIPNVIPIFLGIFIGIILGSIPIFIPGVPAPAKLGLAGGPLLIAILLGYKGRIGKMNFYMTPGANLIIREFGIILFLSCVGLLSGEKFVETILNGGLQWMMYGAIITFLPIVIVATIARICKVNYLKICGCIAGSMTDPPALEFANGIAPVQAQSTAYATVYPLTMFLRILLAQVFILITL